VGAGATVVAVIALGVIGGTGAVANTNHSVARSPSTPSRAASSSRGLDVLPFPGTPDAAPGTSVDFPAVSPSQIASVKVVGSRTGVHAGRLSAQPDNRGTAFSPRRPFAAGERVSVTANLRSVTAGAASGAPGSRRLEFSFSVERPATVSSTTEASMVPGGTARTASGSSTAASSGTHSFVTHPGWHVPWITTSTKDTDTTSGRIFLTAQNSGQNAAYMVNGKGQIQWYHPTDGLAANTRVQNYKGHPVITFWQGGFSSPPGAGRGEDLILNSSYKTLHTVRPGNGFEQKGFDLHDFTLTPQGTALAAVWNPVHANLTSVGGPANGTAFDWIIQEIDIATGKVLWEWHAMGHVPIKYTYNNYTPGRPLEYFHLNSIEQVKGGNIVISARNTWAVYEINKKTGRITWTLGGKHSSFRMGPRAQFYWQHHATLRSGGRLTVFDDGSSPREEKQSRALELRLSTKTHQATVMHAYTHKAPVLASSEGSVELLGNHNVFVGWGSAPFFSEYTPDGRQIFSDGFRHPIESYRAYRLPWTGHPPWSPGIAVRKTSTANHFTVYASWNGATQLGKWRVLVGSSKSARFKAIKTVSWASFETRIPVSTKAAYIKVQGLGQRGRKVLPHGTSRAVRTGS
jgi:Arylsulfotransferase (ASST)